MPSGEVAGGRRVRLLVGWLDERSAAAYGPAATELLHERGASAREAVARRLANTDVATTREWDDNDYSDALNAADPNIAAHGSVLRWVPLRSLRVRQVAVAIDDVEGDVPTDEELAALTVPIQPAGAPVIAYDEAAGAWVLRAPNGSLAVVGRFSGPVEGTGPGTMGFGFVVSAQPSRLEVLEIDGALVIVDGHHRALSLLRRGVEEVAALVRTARPVDLAGVDGIDPEEILSSRAPRLVDYLDDDVAADTVEPESATVLVLSSSELKIPFA